MHYDTNTTGYFNPSAVTIQPLSLRSGSEILLEGLSFISDALLDFKKDDSADVTVESLPVEYNNMVTVVAGYMFIDLATGAEVDRAGHPAVLTISGLLTLAGLLVTVLELRYLIKPATKELLDFVQCVNLVDKARQILESRTSKSLPVRGLDVCRILTAQLEENICQDQANNA